MIQEGFFKASKAAHAVKAAGYCQLHLFVMRHGAAPRKPSGKLPTRCLNKLWWNRLARLAISLGFSTEKIRTLCLEDDGANWEATTFMGDSPVFTANSDPLPTTQRCGRPDHEKLERHRHHLFLDVMREDMVVTTSRNMTWLGVLRDIFFTFFGDLENILPQSNSSPNAVGDIVTTAATSAILTASSVCELSESESDDVFLKPRAVLNGVEEAECEGSGGCSNTANVRPSAHLCGCNSISASLPGVQDHGVSSLDQHNDGDNRKWNTLSPLSGPHRSPPQQVLVERNGVETEEWLVDRIMDSRIEIVRGKVCLEYLVGWNGYEPSWEPRCNLIRGSELLIERFHKKNPCRPSPASLDGRKPK